jgi:hypothetical protein
VDEMDEAAGRERFCDWPGGHFSHAFRGYPQPLPACSPHFDPARDAMKVTTRVGAERDRGRSPEVADGSAH